MLLVSREISASLLVDSESICDNTEFSELISELNSTANMAFVQECHALKVKFVAFRAKLDNKKSSKAFRSDKNQKLDECIELVSKYIEKWEYINECLLWLFEF